MSPRFALSLFLPTIALAQLDRGAITGVIRDASDAGVPGGKIRATQVSTAGSGAIGGDGRR
jgi:hypothetical protein